MSDYQPPMDHPAWPAFVEHAKKFRIDLGTHSVWLPFWSCFLAGTIFGAETAAEAIKKSLASTEA